MKQQTITDALSSLDVVRDDHWTSDGAPRVDAVSEILGRPVTRVEIVAAAPKFVRVMREAVPSDKEDVARSPQTRRYVELGDEIFELQQERGRIEERVAALAKEQNRLSAHAPKDMRQRDHIADQKARMEFIRSQTAQRAERVGRRDSFLRSVADPAASPLDRAMAQENQRAAGEGYRLPQQVG